MGKRTKTPNPYFAFVELSVGGFNLTPVPPEYLIDFSYTRNFGDKANTVEFSLFDESALEMEAIITNSKEDLLFRYGIEGGNCSPLLAGMIQSYTIDFQYGGVVLNVTGISTVMKNTAIPRTRTYKNMDIHQIVKEIVDMEKWGVDRIDECQPVYDIHPVTKVKTKKEFYQTNMPSTQFIEKQLLPFAKRKKDGMSGYKFYCPKDSPGKPTISFHPPDFAPDPIYEFVFEYNREGQEVISFKPEINTAPMFAGAATSVISAYDSYKSKIVTTTFDDKTNAKQQKTGDKSHIASTDGKTIVNLSSGTEDEMANKVANTWYRGAAQVYTATLETTGNTIIKPHDKVFVTVLTKSGAPHHTSGLYIVTQIEDRISGGTFNTTLSLLRLGAPTGPVKKEGKKV